jgi:hypothetical protein
MSYTTPSAVADTGAANGDFCWLAGAGGGDDHTIFLIAGCIGLSLDWPKAQCVVKKDMILSIYYNRKHCRYFEICGSIYYIATRIDYDPATRIDPATPRHMHGTKARMGQVKHCISRSVQGERDN